VDISNIFKKTRQADLPDESMNSQISEANLLIKNISSASEDDEDVNANKTFYDEDDNEEVLFLHKKPLLNKYRYSKDQLGSMRLKDNGEFLRRSFIGNESDYKKTEANKLLQKLNGLQKAKSLIGYKNSQKYDKEDVKNYLK